MAMDNRGHICSFRGAKRLVVCGLLLAGLVATALGASVAGTPGTGTQWAGVGEVRVAYAECDGVIGPPPDLGEGAGAVHEQGDV